jgi:hypothetical protein
MAPFFKVMKGYNESLTTKFTNSWRMGKVTIGPMRFEVLTQFISQAMSLENQGMKVAKKSSANYQDFVDNFLHKGEKLTRFQNGYSRLALPSPFSLVSIFLMRYFTLKGKYMTI